MNFEALHLRKILITMSDGEMVVKHVQEVLSKIEKPSLSSLEKTLTPIKLVILTQTLQFKSGSQTIKEIERLYALKQAEIDDLQSKRDPSRT